MIFVLALSDVEFGYFINNQTIGFGRRDIVRLRNTNQLRGIRDPWVIILEGFLAHGDMQLLDEVRHIIKYQQAVTKNKP